MTGLKVRIKLLDSNARSPVFAHDGDACADVRSNTDIMLKPNEIKLVPTGFAMALPTGYEAQIRPRSGLAIKNKIGILNSPGTIDSGYRGEVKIIMGNFGTEKFQISKGDRIAQMAIRKVPTVMFEVVDNLTETERGEGGFGSTGVN